MNIQPLGRIGRREDIADAVVWLFSDKSSYYTGQSLTLGGGLTELGSSVRPQVHSWIVPRLGWVQEPATAQSRTSSFANASSENLLTLPFGIPLLVLLSPCRMRRTPSRGGGPCFLR